VAREKNPKPTIKPVKPEKRQEFVGKPAARTPRGRILTGRAARRQLAFEKIQKAQLKARKKKLGM